MKKDEISACNAVIELLEKEYNRINYSINSNRYAMKTLVEKQSIMKRERKVLHDQIKNLKNILK